MAGITSDSWTVRSDKDTEFTTALAQDEMELESFAVIPTPKVVVTRITLLSVENLSWRVIFFRDSGADDADADLDTMVEWFDFLDTDGFQIAGTGLYRYAASGLEFLYAPEGRELHLGLMVLSAAGKTIGAGGEVIVEVSGPLV